jgi:hypothetical protein
MQLKTNLRFSLAINTSNRSDNAYSASAVTRKSGNIELAIGRAAEKGTKGRFRATGRNVSYLAFAAVGN